MGPQRITEQADVPAIMPTTTDASGTRTEKLVAWPMGVGRIVAGGPGESSLSRGGGSCG
jgi:hypothetical protein